MSTVYLTTTPFRFATLSLENRALAIELRDACMAARDLARDFDAAHAGEVAKLGYWLLLVAAALPRPQAAQPTPPATPARRPVAELVPSESNPKLLYIVRNHGQSCTCPGFTYRGHCKHSRRAREQRQQYIRTLISQARAAYIAAA